MKNRRKTLREQNKRFKEMSEAYFKNKIVIVYIQLIVISGMILSGALYKDTNNIIALVVFLIFVIVGGYILVKRFLDMRKGL